jgi:hypothetical protein
MNQIQQFAPHLHFRGFEGHMPGFPEDFRRHARLLYHDGSAASVLNPATGRLEPEAGVRDEHFGPSWSQIEATIAEKTGALRPEGVSRKASVSRPADDRSLWGKESRQGFFLQLRDGYARETSGCRGDQRCPIYYDLDDSLVVDGVRYVVLAYWFFYIWNWIHILTHQGDWEHVTLYFRREDFDAGRRPSWVFYAGHESGKFVPGTNDVLWDPDDHLRVYVSPWGHPSLPSIIERFRFHYTRPWRTWEQEILPVKDAEWHRFCGAWGNAGDVGVMSFMNGPLGPYFKLGKDLERGRHGIK